MRRSTFSPLRTAKHFGCHVRPAFDTHATLQSGKWLTPKQKKRTKNCKGLFSRESKHQNPALLFESARVLAIVLSAVDIKKFVSHTSAILKTNYIIAAAIARSMDRAVKNKFFTPTCTKVSTTLSELWNVFSPPHVALAPRVMWSMSENFSEKVFCSLQN